MSRLADYFIVVGYDYEKERTGDKAGKILQRFPDKDWDDSPFMEGLPLFCQPMGWTLSNQRKQPSFYVAILTDMDGERHYCAVFSFLETVATTPTKPDDEEEQEGTIVHHSSMFAPKSLILISRHEYFEVFRNCLGIIYTVYVDSLPVRIETLVGNILGCVQVPPAGGPQIRFSIGAKDRQALQPPLSSSLPISNTAVAILFDQLGINNTMTVFSAALTDHKILFYSESCTRLCDACRAIAALHYPLKYMYVFVPVLPITLIEVLNSPTPFIVGVHATLKSDIADLLDVIVVDLDGGSVRIPENVTVNSITQRVLTRAKQALTMILTPDLLSADFAFTTSPRKLTPIIHRDKELRAVFIRMFAELFQGYRSSLSVVRIHPTPFITFHKAHFLGERNMVEEEFLLRLLDGMSFSAFISERGSPYRICDIFDEVVATIDDQIKEEFAEPSRVMVNVKDLANQLFINEFPNQEPYVPKVPRATEGAYARIHQPPFPMLEGQLVQEIIDEGLINNSLKKLNSVRPQQSRNVPMGMSPSSWSLQRMQINNARRLEVLKNCIGFIFDNKISEAKIIFPAVMRALESSVVRLALVQELGDNVKSNRAMLEHQQYDLVVKLLDCALMNDSSLDENGVAAGVLPMAMSFCRKLCTGVIQFSYTCIQEHAVWNSTQFWEQAYFQDVQNDIRKLYLPWYEEHSVMMGKMTESCESDASQDNMSSSSTLKPRHIGPLEIAAEQLRIWPTMTAEQQHEMINNEESTVYCQAIHYVHRIVALRVPLDASRSMKNSMGVDENSSTVTPSVGESDSFDAESGFDESEQTDVAATVTKFVSRFIDKVCIDGGVTQEHIKSLHQMIPGVVAMHIETLEAVNRESKRLPPVQKPKILKPAMLPGERIVMEGLRVYLLPDGREEGSGGSSGGPCLLPAVGAVFLTTYRIIFKGTPCDPFVCDQVVVRGFPVSSLTKEKKIRATLYATHLDQGPQEGLQLRSTMFQLMKITFDEEVGSDNIETFRKLIHKVRNPSSIFNTFAFTSHLIQSSTQIQKNKEKNASLRHFAKRTLLKTARKAGLKKHKTKHVSPHPPLSRRSTGNPSPRSSDSESECTGSTHPDELSVIDENEFAPSYSSDPKNVERLMELYVYQDYQRLGLGSVATSGQRGGRSEPFRVSTVNSTYSLARSYPALLVVPQSVSDESIRKFSRSHRQSRFPVITWRHPKTRALLLRASGFHSKGFMGMWRQNTPTGTSSGGEASSSLEHEKFFKLLAAATPSSHRGQLLKTNSDSLTSLDSLLMTGLGTSPLSSPTVETPQSPDAAHQGNGRVAAGKRISAPPPTGYGKSKPGSIANRVGSLRVDRSPNSNAKLMPNARDPASSSLKGMHYVALYVLGEKAQMKVIKAEAYPQCDFIPVEFYEVRQVKASFKKLMRACVPSTPLSTSGHTFHKAVQDSEWLLQLRSVIQLAGAVVDLMDIQGSSVMICLEEGWDITSQVMSVAQVMLDPYYRTIEGFIALIEKEWLAFGHRFSHRNNQTSANQTNGFGPIFLQFLDIVHQIHHQYSLSFEFSQYFLRFLAYHCVSNRFRTFMMDSEFERVEAGWLLDESIRTSSISSDTHIDDGMDALHNKHGGFLMDRTLSWERSNHSTGTCIWQEIIRLSKDNPLFFNFPYVVDDEETVLRPYSNVSNMRIWDFYLREDLSHGVPYEPELAEDPDQNAELEAEAMGVVKRRVFNSCYQDMSLHQPDYYWSKIQEIHRMEEDLGMKLSPWRALWDRLECPGRDHFTRQISTNTQQNRSHGRSIHKNSTVEILLRGKMLGDNARLFPQPHRFDKHTYTTPTYCDQCSQILWGLSKTGMQCADCGYNCHERCQSSVPKNCRRLKVVTEPGMSSVAIQDNGGPVMNDSSNAPTANFGTYEPGDAKEHSIREGYLFKQGALFRQWKQRWFILDSMKHQLRYYETVNDPSCKGYIDLAEVESVSLVKSIPGAPKRAQENSFIEIRAVRRAYNFMAPNSKEAADWIEKLQGCLQRD